MLPNFLIIGAKKSGTTSLHFYLDQHHEIYMSPIKDTHFFVAQKTKNANYKNQITTIKQYKELFKGATQAKARGETSADYLYFYKEAIRQIQKILPPSIKIITILRNPIERALSDYMHGIRVGHEQYSFRKAIELEKNKNSRERQKFPLKFNYLEIGKYYKPLQAYFQQFKNIKVITTDELQRTPQKTLEALCAFLCVDSNFQFNVSKTYNKGHWVPRFRVINNIINKMLKYPASNSFMHSMLSKLKNFQPKKNIYITQATKDYLIDYYKSDIIKTQQLIKKDLSHWLE